MLPAFQTARESLERPGAGRESRRGADLVSSLHRRSSRSSLHRRSSRLGAGRCAVYLSLQLQARPLLQSHSCSGCRQDGARVRWGSFIDNLIQSNLVTAHKTYVSSHLFTSPRLIGRFWLQNVLFNCKGMRWGDQSFYFLYIFLFLYLTLLLLNEQRPQLPFRRFANPYFEELGDRLPSLHPAADISAARKFAAASWLSPEPDNSGSASENWGLLVVGRWGEEFALNHSRSIASQ